MKKIERQSARLHRWAHYDSALAVAEVETDSRENSDAIAIAHLNYTSSAAATVSSDSNLFWAMPQVLQLDVFLCVVLCHIPLLHARRFSVRAC